MLIVKLGIVLKCRRIFKRLNYCGGKVKKFGELSLIFDLIDLLKMFLYNFNDFKYNENKYHIIFNTKTTSY